MELSNKRLIKSAIYWLLAFVAVYFIGFTLIGQIRDAQISMSTAWFDTFINEDYQKLERYVEIKPEDNDKILYNVARPNPDDLSMSEVKTIEIEVIDASLTSFAVGLAFCFAVPFRIRKKIKFIVIMILSLFLANAVKYLAMVYDNYTFPEFVLIDDLPIIIEEIVYFINWFLAKTGSISASVILPALIWIVIMVSDAEVRKIFSDN